MLTATNFCGGFRDYLGLITSTVPDIITPFIDRGVCKYSTIRSRIVEWRFTDLTGH